MWRWLRSTWNKRLHAAERNAELARLDAARWQFRAQVAEGQLRRYDLRVTEQSVTLTRLQRELDAAKVSL